MIRDLMALLWIAFLAVPVHADEVVKPVLIGLDAEFGHKTSTSAQAVQQGIEIALTEINAAGGVLGGRPLKLEIRDNRSITARGVDNLRDLATIPDLVAVFGGKFSPIYLEAVPIAHELGMILLDPWGSADPITSHNFKPSYSFRLSLRDSWAAPTFLRYARETLKVTRVGALFPNTGWGRSNRAALFEHAPSSGVSVVAERWYSWGDTSLKAQYQELRHAGAQAVVLVANEAEGSIFVREVAQLPEEERLPIISHWGITGGAFSELAGDALHKVNLAVIQTFSFIGLEKPAAQRVVAALKSRYGIESVEKIRSPVGIAHAYDLTYLLAQAINRAGSTDRAAIRTALEQLSPYEGLVRRYDRPFTAENHDALSLESAFMARYTADDHLIPIDRR